MAQRTLKTRCKLCDARGEVKVSPRSDGQVDLVDLVKHRFSCDRYKGPKPQPKHLSRKKWERQEKRANLLVGARETLMSGAVNEDGDGRVFHEWRVEAKQTRLDKYRLTTRVWEKLCKGALEAGEEPLLHLEIGNLIGATRFVVVRSDWLDEETTSNPGGMLEVKGAGVNIYPEHIQTTPMWVEGMSPTPWLLTEREFQELKRKADGPNEDSVRVTAEGA